MCLLCASAHRQIKKRKRQRRKDVQRTVWAPVQLCLDGHLWVPRGVWLRSRPGWTSCFVASVATSTMKTRSLGFGHNAIMATTQCSWKCTLISFTISKICLFLRAGEIQNQHHTNLWAPLAVDGQTQSVVLMVLLPAFGSFYYILQFDSALEMNGNDMVAE